MREKQHSLSGIANTKVSKALKFFEVSQVQNPSAHKITLHSARTNRSKLHDSLSRAMFTSWEAYDMPLTDIITANSIKDIQDAEDKLFIRKLSDEYSKKSIK